MRRRLAIIVATAALGIGGAAFAHHGWGSYDASRVITLENAVTKLEWQNPHVHLAVMQGDESWDLVLAPPFRMEARGLTPESIKVGARIRAEGYASTRVAREMRAERITVEGKTYELR